MIKVTVNEEKKEGKSMFPCLMKHSLSGIIILASDRGIDGAFIGTAINGIKRPLGTYDNNWSCDFKPFYGSVTLEND